MDYVDMCAVEVGQILAEEGEDGLKEFEGEIYRKSEVYRKENRWLVVVHPYNGATMAQLAEARARYPLIKYFKNPDGDVYGVQVVERIPNGTLPNYEYPSVAYVDSRLDTYYYRVLPGKKLRVITATGKTMKFSNFEGWKAVVRGRVIKEREYEAGLEPWRAIEYIDRKIGRLGEYQSAFPVTFPGVQRALGWWGARRQQRALEIVPAGP